MGNMIYIHEVTDSYAACITNMTLYNRIAIDVAKRWVSILNKSFSSEDPPGDLQTHVSQTSIDMSPVRLGL